MNLTILSIVAIFALNQFAEFETGIQGDEREKSFNHQFYCNSSALLASPVCLFDWNISQGSLGTVNKFYFFR